VIGEGFHEAAGRPHAETVALAASGHHARGATLYVTLEPCAHHGRTPPCAPAVVAAGVRRVVIATGDPDPRVNGRGLEILRSAGVDVAVGVLGDEAVRQNRVFFTSSRQGRPHVTLKAAMTLDGRIADVHGTSQWITGEAARREAHRLRSEVDAIIVGVETALRDDPALTVRLERPWPREPYRVVLDTSARTPPAARLISSGTPSRAVVVVGAHAPVERMRGLEATGATVVRVSERDARVDVQEILAALFARDVRGVLVEGGSEVHAGFLEAGLVDRVAIFVAPRLLGGRAAPGVIGGVGRALKDAARLRDLTVHAIGDDLLIEADLARGE